MTPGVGATQFIFTDPNVDLCASRRPAPSRSLPAIDEGPPKKGDEERGRGSGVSRTIRRARPAPAQLGPAADHGLGAGVGQPVGMAGIGVGAAGEADHPHARPPWRRRCRDRILDDEGSRRVGLQRLGRVEEHVRRRLRLAARRGQRREDAAFETAASGRPCASIRSMRSGREFEQTQRGPVDREDRLAHAVDGAHFRRQPLVGQRLGLVDQRGLERDRAPFPRSAAGCP